MDGVAVPVIYPGLGARPGHGLREPIHRVIGAGREGPGVRRHGLMQRPVFGLVDRVGVAPLVRMTLMVFAAVSEMARSNTPANQPMAVGDDN